MSDTVVTVTDQNFAQEIAETVCLTIFDCWA